MLYRKPVVGAGAKRGKATKAARHRAEVKARARRKTTARLARHAMLLEHERALWTSGLRGVAGLDEAGAGPLAGPVVAACVVLDPDHCDELVGVNDSKQLREAERETLAVLIKAHARAWAVASASVEEIDRINILQAALLAMRRALETVLRSAAVEHLLIDARRLEVQIPQTPIIKGDGRSLSIAAASVLAKVERDRQMTAHALDYPEYGFERHKGYATEDHLAAVRRLGVTPIHRRSFAPIATLITQPSLF